MPAMKPSLRTRLIEYLRLMRLDRPVGIWLLLWPTLWALWLAAGGMPPWPVLAVFVAGTVLMRSAGCAINDYADRDFDAHVARTRTRPLATGRISPREALLVAACVALLALGLLLLLRNARVVALAVPAVLLATVYPFMKRFISLPQAVLGVAFSWGIPMAFAAVRGHVDWMLALLLMLANLCWVIAYDTWYAMVDREDDLRIGVKSSAILFGRHDLAVIAGLHGMALLALFAAGMRAQLGGVFHAALVLATLWAAGWLWHSRRRGLAACFSAFRYSHWFGALIFAGIGVDYALRT